MTLRTFVALAIFALGAAPAVAAKGNAAAGQSKAEPCKACHGEAGNSENAAFPKIAGQYADYLATALRHYKLGKRKNPIMAGQVANLSERDILDLAAYYAAKSGLEMKY